LDMRQLAPVHVLKGELVADREDLAINMIDRVPVLVGDREVVAKTEDFLGHAIAHRWASLGWICTCYSPGPRLFKPWCRCEGKRGHSGSHDPVEKRVTNSVEERHKVMQRILQPKIT